MGFCIFFADLLATTEPISIIPVLFAILELCMATAAFFTCVLYCHWAPNLIEFHNKMLNFVLTLWIKYSSGPNQTLILSEIWKIQKYRFKFKLIQLPNGKIDLIGVFVNILVADFAIVPSIFPWIAILLAADIPYYRNSTSAR